MTSERAARLLDDGPSPSDSAAAAHVVIGTHAFEGTEALKGVVLQEAGKRAKGGWHRGGTGAGRAENGDGDGDAADKGEGKGKGGARSGAGAAAGGSSGSTAGASTASTEAVVSGTAQGTSQGTARAGAAESEGALVLGAAPWYDPTGDGSAGGGAADTSESVSSSDESVLLVDRNNRPVGPIPRSRMRQENLWHRASFVFIRTGIGLLLVQLRSRGKDYCPSHFDTSTGGVVGANEADDMDGSAAREVAEEVGILVEAPAWRGGVLPSAAKGAGDEAASASGGHGAARGASSASTGESKPSTAAALRADESAGGLEASVLGLSEGGRAGDGGRGPHGAGLVSVSAEGGAGG